jgi:predicted amidohydrolase
MGLKLALIMMVLMTAMGGAGYWYYQDTQKKMNILVANEAKATVAAEVAEASVQAMKEYYEAMDRENKIIKAKYKEIEDRAERLQNKLSKHDIGVLGIAKDSLTEKVITKMSNSSLRCIEITSGAELTEEELTATKPSEINSECYEIANPNFDPKLYPVWLEKNR